MFLYGFPSNSLIDDYFETVDEFLKNINSFVSINISRFSNDKTPTDEEIEKLLLAIKNHKNLNRITLYGIKLNDKQSALLREALSENKNLKELDLSSCEIDNSFYSYFTSESINNLKKINFSGASINDNTLSQISKFIEKSTLLTNINISTDNISDDAALNFANALKINTSLEFLRIKNSFSAIGFGHIAEALKSTKITYLYISGNLLKTDVIREIASKIEGNKLQTLAINDIVFDASAALNVAKIIESSNDLKSISLRDCDVSDNNVKVIFEAANKAKLKEIDLNSCKLTNLGAAEIASVITNNKSLKSLGLSNNDIGDDGLKTLLTAINTTKIEEVSIVGIKITYEGAKEIAKFLESNNTVTNINLMLNDITDEGAKAIAKALEKNKNIEFLFLPNGISNELTKSIESICDNNRSAKCAFYLPSKNDFSDFFVPLSIVALLASVLFACVLLSPYFPVFAFVAATLLAIIDLAALGSLAEFVVSIALPTSPKAKQVPANTTAEKTAPAQDKSFRQNAEQSAGAKKSIVTP